jgi:lipoprotein-anchoring transpeptidase ErfK/SrfK
MNLSRILTSTALAMLLAQMPAAAQSLGQQWEPATTGSLGRADVSRDIIRAANGIGGGFIETLMTDEGWTRHDINYRRHADTPLPPLPGGDPVYAPAEPVQRLPNQRRGQGSLDRTPVAVQRIDSIYERQTVDYNGPHGAGTVVIDTNDRFLYLVQPGGTALRYGIGVGRPGFEWAGNKTITRKAEWPDWRPPAQMRKRRPDLPEFMEGGPGNPLGARAMYLGSSLYRIHGTNEPSTIGQAVSSGCIRMKNDDVKDLYNRVRVGTRVVVM